MSLYEHYNRVRHEDDAREGKRRAHHARMIREARVEKPASGSLLRRLLARLPRRRRSRPLVVAPAGLAATLTTAARTTPIVIGVLRMTEATCLLPDGSHGHIGIDWRSDDDWTALCVPVALREDTG